MKRLWRWAFRLFTVLVILLVLGILLLDTIARVVVARQIRNETGLETKIGRVHIGLLRPEVSIENLVLYNKPEFGGAPFIELPELHIEYDRDALFERRVHCKLVRFNLARVNIVEDKNGRRNIDFFQPRTRPPGSVGDAPQASPRHGNDFEAIEFFGIDKLDLTLGKATYVQMAQPGQIDELDMNFNHQIFPSIRSPGDVEGLLFIICLKSKASIRPDGTMRDWLKVFNPTQH